jgi:hypothetical protein
MPPIFPTSCNSDWSKSLRLPNIADIFPSSLKHPLNQFIPPEEGGSMLLRNRGTCDHCTLLDIPPSPPPIKRHYSIEKKLRTETIQIGRRQLCRGWVPSVRRDSISLALCTRNANIKGWDVNGTIEFLLFFVRSPVNSARRRHWQPKKCQRLSSIEQFPWKSAYGLTYPHPF